MHQTREIYRPQGITCQFEAPELGIEVYYEGELVAKAFAGKRSKPDFYMRFRDAARRDEYVNQWIAGIKDAAERKMEAGHVYC